MTSATLNALWAKILNLFPTKTQVLNSLLGKQDVINDLSDIRSGAAAGATAYQKPAGGIPKNDLAQGVKDSLDKADSAIQEDTLYEDANGHDYVEIAGMKWATKNIGAENITDAGLYFQWGDTQGYTAEQVGTGEGKKAFTWADYKYATNIQGNRDITKYNVTDGKTVLDIEDDAARANWGGTWRMPTAEEIQVFNNAVNTVYTDDYQGSGVAGLVCTDKTDISKVVFFPAIGNADSGVITNFGMGEYWSKSVAEDDIEDGLRLSYSDAATGGISISEDGRFVGSPIRPILDTTQLKKDLDSKADKVPNATNGNFAGLDANGNITDSGSKASDFATTQQLPTTMGASGSGHKGGLVPDTPSTAGTTKFLCEDGTWKAVDMSGKEDVTTIVTPVNETDATLPVTSLACEVGKYYRIDVPVETLAVTLPAMTDNTTVRTVVLYLTTGTTPAITFSSAAPVYYNDGFELEAGKTYEVNALFNGSAWIIASVEIVV